MRYAQNIKIMNERFFDAAVASAAESIVSMPMDITLTMLHRCNYRCVMCYQTDYEKEMDWGIVDKVLPLLPFAKTLQLFGGEPLLYPRIEELMQLAQQNGCLVTMISNGSLLTDSMVQRIVDNQVCNIKFSIDAGTAKTYKAIRGGNFFKVMAGIGKISQRKLAQRLPYPLMDFNFLAMKSNVRELPRLLVMAAELGIRSINVFYPSIAKAELLDECLWLHQEYADEMLLKAFEVSRQVGVSINLPPFFSDKLNERGLENVGGRGVCAEPWKTLIVDTDGSASLCCAGPTRIGNMLTDDFAEIWNGKFARSLRRAVNTDSPPSYCRSCRIRKVDPKNVRLHLAGHLAAGFESQEGAAS